MNKGNSIGIIGAGVAGLAAGCYARMNGYQVTLFESHSLPGGLCTSWKRGHYLVDGCIQWLVGTNPKGSFHQGWMELGALQGKKIINHDLYAAYETLEGQPLFIYTNLDRLEGHLLDYSPQDARTIHRLCKTIRLFSKIDARKLKWTDFFLAPLHLWRMASAFLTPLDRFALQFKDPLLKEVFNPMGMGDFPMAIFALMMAWHHNRNAGYPVGGSLAFAQSIENRFLELGGQIRYQSKVDKILVREGKAVGLQLQNEEEHFFDRIISASDGYATFDHLLGAAFNDDKLRRKFEKLKPFGSVVMVSFGVRRSFSKEPHNLFLSLKDPIVMEGKTCQRLNVRHFDYDPTLAPEGGTLLQATFEGDYDYWKNLHEDPAIYEREKTALAQKVLAQLEIRFPGIASQVEMTDVVTPLTFERYTNNWRGSIEGWFPTCQALIHPLPKTISSLKGLYFTGQWVQPGGGLPSCLMTGKRIIQRICREDRKAFQTTLPLELFSSSAVPVPQKIEKPRVEVTLQQVPPTVDSSLFKEAALPIVEVTCRQEAPTLHSRLSAKAIREKAESLKKSKIPTSINKSKKPLSPDSQEPLNRS